MITQNDNSLNAKIFEEDSLILKDGHSASFALMSDLSTLASVSKENFDDEMKSAEEPQLNDRALSRMNYFCYVDGCDCSFKYLYLFKYHLASHSIYHFDCTLCGTRFLKYLEFKKHFKIHQMSILNYKVTSSKIKAKSNEPRRTYCNKKRSSAFKEPLQTYSNSMKQTNFDNVIVELFTLLNTQIKSQASDFSIFDQTILQIRQEDFPSFGSSIYNA